MLDSGSITALETVIASADGVTGCVVTTSAVGPREVLVAHISTAPDAPVPPLRATLDGEGLSVPHHVACWDVLSSAIGDRCRALNGELVDGHCIAFGLDTAEKRAIAEVWASVLRPSSLGTGDSFLELGGHSLLAMRMLAAVDGAFGVRVPIYEFLDDPTVAGLAKQVAPKVPHHVSIESIPIRDDVDR